MTKEERAEYNRHYRKENAPHINFLIKKWIRQNEQKNKEIHRKWRSENKEQIKIYQRLNYIERSSGIVKKRYNTKSTDFIDIMKLSINDECSSNNNNI